MPGRVVRGCKAIAEILGSSRLASVAEWRKKHKDCPIKKDSTGHLYVNSELLARWALKKGILKPQTPAELEIANEGGTGRLRGPMLTAPDEPNQPEVAIPPSQESDGGDMGGYIDLLAFDSIEEPTGDIEDELRSARKMRHRLEKIVFSWRLKTLGDPASAKFFIEYSTLLVKQLAVIGRLDQDLVRQRLRLGQLLDKESVDRFVVLLAKAHESLFQEFWDRAFRASIDECKAAAATQGFDLDVNSDKVFKIGNVILGEVLDKDALVGEAIAEQVSREQSDRVGFGEDEVADL